MADHPLRPANDRSLGRQLPHQLANRTQAPRQAVLQPLAHRRHAVLAPVSQGYPPPNDKSLRVTHPSATDTEMPVRLACVKHAASVRSEPGSNSQVHLPTHQSRKTNKPAQRTKPKTARNLSPNPKHLASQTPKGSSLQKHTSQRYVKA